MGASLRIEVAEDAAAVALASAGAEVERRLAGLLEEERALHADDKEAAERALRADHEAVLAVLKAKTKAAEESAAAQTQRMAAECAEASERCVQLETEAAALEAALTSEREAAWEVRVESVECNHSMGASLRRTYGVEAHGTNGDRV